MQTTPAQIIDEYGPFPGIIQVHGVSYDGQHVWFASGDKLNRLDPQGSKADRSIELPAHAGTAFDGTYLYQIAEQSIQKIDPESGQVIATIATPEGGSSGLAWAEGSLWLGQYQNRKILQIDPHTGELISSLDSNRYVTGVTWLEGELWHGTWEGEESELRRIDANSGEVLERLKMPADVGVSGLESNGSDRFFCGGGNSGKIRVVHRQK